MSVLWVVLIAGVVLATGALLTAIGRASTSSRKDRSPADRYQDQGALVTFAGAVFSVVGAAGALYAASTDTVEPLALAALVIGLIVLLVVLFVWVLFVEAKRPK